MVTNATLSLICSRYLGYSSINHTPNRNFLRPTLPWILTLINDKRYGNLLGATGFGDEGRQLLLSLHRAGIHVRAVSIEDDKEAGIKTLQATSEMWRGSEGGIQTLNPPWSLRVVILLVHHIIDYSIIQLLSSNLKLPRLLSSLACI